jgi:predicted alpha/beta hydrolase family esterase
MAIQVLFIQGAGANVHEAWDRKLVDSLERELGAAYHVRYPRMPKEDDPTYATWKPALLHELASLDDGAILVGHSVGGTMLLHVLAEQPPRFQPGALILIAAPFIGDGGWPSDGLPARTDFGDRLPAGLRVILVHGAADETVPSAHVQRYARTIPQATVRVLADRDHQLDNDLGEVARELSPRREATCPAAKQTGDL